MRWTKNDASSPIDETPSKANDSSSDAASPNGESPWIPSDDHECDDHENHSRVFHGQKTLAARAHGDRVHGPESRQPNWFENTSNDFEIEIEIVIENDDSFENDPCQKEHAHSRDPCHRAR
jgi:hypothetical protein